MIEIQGKYNKATIYTDLIDRNAISQVYKILNDPISKDCNIAFMPDIHAGKNVPIGTSIKLPDDKTTWKVCPDIVSGDIGCGMLAVKIKEKEIDFKKLDKVIQTHVPNGFEVFECEQENKEIENLIHNKLKAEISNEAKSLALKSLGTLGGGNHFIELDKDSNDNIWLVIHSGSRNFGQQINKYHMKKAEAHVKRKYINHIINKLKNENRHKEIESVLKNTNYSYNNLYYLEGELLKDYLNDMKIGVKYASENRKHIAKAILKYMNLEKIDEFESIHNYLDTKNGIIRKGATEALDNQRLIIPINMKDGSLIAIASGDKNWNYSAPHGAGRKLSRSEAKDIINLEDYQNSMKGIYSSSVTLSTIHESAFAYKNINDIINNLNKNIKIIEHIKPIYNFKAH